MKRILIGWMAALSALLCACSAQTVWETVDGGCVPAEGGAAYAIRIALPQDAVEEVFAERGARQIYTQPGGGYEITTEILDAAPPPRSSGGCRASMRPRCTCIRAAARTGPSGSLRGTRPPTRAGVCTAAR